MLNIRLLSVLLILGVSFQPLYAYAHDNEHESKTKTDNTHRVTILNSNSSINAPVKDWLSIRNKNLVQQKFDFTCGASSVATILSYFYDVQIEEKSIVDSILKSKGIEDKDADDLESSDFFLSFDDLKTFANSVEFKGIGLSLPMESLNKLKTPAIVHIKVRNTTHFSVYKGIDDRYVYLADPSFGNIKIPVNKFKNMFYAEGENAGLILVFLPQDNQKNNVKNLAFMDISHEKDITYKAIGNALSRAIR